MGRSVLPINDLSPLANAVAALQALSNAAAARTTAFASLTNVPQYQQFTKSVGSLLSGASGQAVKSGGQIVQTPQQAVAAIPGLVSQIQAAHQALILSVTTLAGGQDDYNDVNLASVVAQSVITNASTVLSGHLATLTPLLPAQRLATIRQVVLDVIASQTVVTQFGSNQGTTDIYELSGTGYPYSDSTSLALPATSTVDTAAPYNIQSPNQYLDLYMDGAGTTPRSLTSVTSIAPVGFAYVALFTAASIPADVQVGDYIFPKTGPNAGTRWVIQSVTATTMTAWGVTLAQASAATTIEILPAPSVELLLPFAQSATILGIVAESQYTAGIGYIISDGTHPVRYPTSLNTPAANNVIQFQVGTSVITCNLTVCPDAIGSTDTVPRTAQQVCNDINTNLVPAGFQAVPYFPALKFSGQVIQTLVSGSNANFALVGGIGSFTALGVATGDLIQVTNGDVTQQGAWQIYSVSSTTLGATKVGGGTAETQADPITIQVGSPFRCIKIVAVNPTTAVNTLATIGVINDGATSSNAGATIGLTPGATSRSSPQTSKDIAAYITANTTVATATTLFSPTVSCNGRSNPTNAFLLSLSKLIQTVSLTAAGVNMSAPIAGAADAGVVAGDYIVQRTGDNVGTVWEVVAVTDSIVTGFLLTGAGVSQPGVQLEIGPSVSLSSYSMVRVSSGPNKGDYYVSSQNYLDITLVSTLPQPYDPATMQAITSAVMTGSESLVIASTNTTTASLLKVRGPAASTFYTSGDPAIGVGVPGTTTFFQIPSVPQGLSVGDLLQLFGTSPVIPTQVQAITAINGKVITLDGSIASNVSWQFGDTQPVPFARLHTAAVADFSEFQAELLAWAALPAQQSLYFTNLNAAINPILANSSPTGVQINTALNTVALLYQTLTEAAATTYSQDEAATLEYILDSYVVDDQPQVDSLIRAYGDKGADRAIDLLLAGSFQEFFGLDPNETSYAGTMQEAAKAVAMNDLPVKKTNRTNTQTSQLTGSTTDPDPEYNYDDSANGAPDPLSPDEQADAS